MNTTKCVKLNNGKLFPVVGLGTYKSGPVAQAVKDAIDAGYRHLDCAWFYGNEAEVGEGVAAKLKDETLASRDDIFITTKLWNTFHAKDQVVPALKESLAALKQDYVDLYLVHWPFAFKPGKLWPIDEGASAYSDIDYLETWKGMEECVELGLAKSIGISNFNSKQIDRLLANCEIKPVVNQVEVNPNVNQKKLIKFCKDRDIVVTGYTPLGRSEYAGRPGYPPPTIFDPKVKEIAAKHNATPAQIVLNYLVDVLGIAVVPKSVTKSRIVENVGFFGIALDQADVEYLDSLNKNDRVCGLWDFKDHKYFPFNEEF